MPRKLFRKISLKRDELAQRWYLAPFKHLLQDSRLWGIARRTVVPALSVGLFIGWLPIPGHILAATLLAVAFRINVPIAVVASMITNPLTAGPMYYFAFRVGAWILGIDASALSFELSFDGFLRVWNPLLLGCLLLGTASAIISYIVVDLLWRASVSDYARKRKLRRQR